MSPRDVETALVAAKVLAPVIADTAKWLKGEGPKPPALATLPDELQSELALAQAELRAKQGG